MKTVKLSFFNRPNLTQRILYVAILNKDHKYIRALLSTHQENT